MDCLCVFEIARPGDVIVIDAFGETEISIWGGLMSGLARNAGIAGAVLMAAAVIQMRRDAGVSDNCQGVRT